MCHGWWFASVDQANEWTWWSWRSFPTCVILWFFFCWKRQWIFNPFPLSQCQPVFKTEKSCYWKVSVPELSSSKFLLPHSTLFWGDEIITFHCICMEISGELMGIIEQLCKSIFVFCSFPSNFQHATSISWTVVFTESSNVANYWQ